MQEETKAILIAGRAIWRMKLVILLVAIISAGAVYYQQSKTPRMYEANADLLFRFGREYYPISPGEQRRNWGENVIVSLDAAIFTEMRLLTSHQLFDRTLETVGIDEVARSPTQEDSEATEDSEGDPRLSGIRRLAGMFDISRVDGASLVEVTARHSLPDVADKLLNAHVENYLAWRSELFDRDASAYFEAQLSRAREEHASLLAARKALVTEYGILDAPLEREMLRRDLTRSEERRSENRGDDGSDSRADAILERLQNINTFESLVQPLDARIEAVLDNIASLESEEANWNLSQDFGAAVAPSVVTIDFRTANGSPIGVSPTVGAALAGVMSAILAGLFAAGYGLISEAAGRRSGEDVESEGTA